MPFWRDATGQDPKRSYRFLLRIPQTGIKSFTIQSCKKPALKFKSTILNYLGHMFRYLGPAEWTPIDVTLVDCAGNEDVSLAIAKLIQNSGYRFPLSENDKSSISKREATQALGTVTIDQLGAGNADEDTPIESWVLHNAQLAEVDFGSLKYEDEKLVEIKINLVYDWAEIQVNGQRIWT
jgi:hypothetical protein